MFTTIVYVRINIWLFVVYKCLWQKWVFGYNKMFHFDENIVIV